MTKRLLLFTIACFCLSFAESCHTSEPVVASRTTRQPKFISNIYINPHNKTSATVDAIDHKKYIQKPKPAPRPQPKPAASKTLTASVSKHVPEPAPAPEFSEPINTFRRKYAEMLKVDDSVITNLSLYKFIDKWLGTDYRIGGCDLNGIDCSGFAQKLYSDVYGIDLLRTSTEQFTNCKRIKNPKDAAEGDLVFFHIRGKRISHVGVYLANDYFVHASTTGGVMISNLNEDYWRASYAGCGRVPKG